MTAHADLVLRARHILTPDVVAGSGSRESGFVAIRDGVIVALGANNAAAPWAAAAHRVIDLDDATVTAGLVDAHIHPVLGLTMARGLDLSGITSWVDARRALASYVADQKDGWILGWGLDTAVFEGRTFDNSLFDGIADGRLVFITLFDAHSSLVSRLALEEAGVTGREKFVDSSRVGLDDDGRPNGCLFEGSAQALVQRILPELTFDERVDGLGRLLTGMAESGLTGGQMLDLGAADSFDLLDELERRGDLPLYLRISPWIMPGFVEDDLERMVRLQGRKGRRWHVRGIKLMIDGTIDNGTAWLMQPDTHGESRSSLWLDPDEYTRVLAFFHERSIPTTTHAIGDQGISFVARAIGAQPSNGTVHRIEHIETLPDAVLDEIIASGAAVSMQPTHCVLYTRADHTDNWSMRLGDERANLAWRIGDLRRRGAIVTLGSDWPVAPFDPRSVLAAAQLRRPAGHKGIQPVLPEQALSAAHSLEGYTSEFWRSIGEDGGTIEVGARADLTVFALNPLTTAPDDFATSAVLLTVVDGEITVDNTSQPTGGPKPLTPSNRKPQGFDHPEH